MMIAAQAAPCHKDHRNPPGTSGPGGDFFALSSRSVGKAQKSMDKIHKK